MDACSDEGNVPELDTTGSQSQADQVTGDPPVCDIGSTDTLAQFVTKCQNAVGGVVPEFHCDQGTAVPENHLTGSGATAICDQPNVLHGVCDPGSHFQMLDAGDPNVLVAAHCRHQAYLGNGPSQYGDIAVIQYNKKNGNTCFYQALTNNMPEDVPSPASPGTFPWKSPGDTASINCVRCHDNGPFVRSEYLAQLRDDDAGANVLYGTGYAERLTWNSNQPYNFVGADFQSWRVYSVSDIRKCSSDADCSAGGRCNSSHRCTTCTDCHRMGMSSTNGAYNPIDGTSQNFGGIATAATMAQKNPHSPTSKIWMKPDSTYYDAGVESESTFYKACASALANGTTIPAGCQFASYGQGDTCRGPPFSLVVNGATQSSPVGPIGGSGPIGGPCPADSGACVPGFIFYTSVHGPFWQSTGGSIPFGQSDASVTPYSPGYRGAYLDFIANGQWTYQFGSMPISGSSPAPGGTISGISFGEIATVPNPNNCGSTGFAANDPNGLLGNVTTNMGPPVISVDVVSGFIGNVAQSNGNTGGNGDYVRAYDNSTNAVVQEFHMLPEGPYDGGARAEGFTNGCGAWSPTFYARDVYTETDVQLAPPSKAGSVVCYISGLKGAWASTRDGGAVQPYAKVYVGSAQDVRLTVFPQAPASDKVGAYGSCFLRK